MLQTLLPHVGSGTIWLLVIMVVALQLYVRMVTSRFEVAMSIAACVVMLAAATFARMYIPHVPLQLRGAVAIVCLAASAILVGFACSIHRSWPSRLSLITRVTAQIGQVALIALSAAILARGIQTCLLSMTPAWESGINSTEMLLQRTGFISTALFAGLAIVAMIMHRLKKQQSTGVAKR